MSETTFCDQFTHCEIHGHDMKKYTVERKLKDKYQEWYAKCDNCNLDLRHWQYSWHNWQTEVLSK